MTDDKRNVEERQTNSNRNRDGLLFGLGLAAGAFVGWFLNSDTGRKLRSDTAQTINDWSEKAIDGAEELMSKSKSMAEQYRNKAEDSMNKVAQSAEELVDSHN